MVDREYMLEKPPGPSPVKRFLDQKLMPLAIDVAGTGEVAIERLSQRTGVRPAILTTALAGGAFLSLKLAAALLRRRPRHDIDPAIDPDPRRSRLLSSMIER